ncbi:unnamed protein product [Enterobius vermicularis]|uniref:Gamma-glutamyltranspeptidase 1 n=1 Tax=Enterobius vermicularis TaxID=51028 RepID=A0A158QAB5_ENTVE|nr:unnamed protein product [Enterobius vermicularis]
MVSGLFWLERNCFTNSERIYNYLLSLRFQRLRTIAQVCDDSPGCAKEKNYFLGRYSRAAVSSQSVYCSEIGREKCKDKFLRNTMLKGGNAVDAAIATMFCIGVLDVLHSGLGGGHFMTIYNATTQRCSVINAREMAPKAANETMFVGSPDRSSLGWLAIAVPGELHGFWTAYKRFGGKIPWKQLVQPTIDLLEMGHPTSYIMARALDSEEDHIMKEPSLKQFINPKTGRVYKEGEQITTRKAFTRTLKAIANTKDPVKLFYNGTLTLRFVQEFKKNGGILELSDFNSYRSKVHEGDEVIYSKLSNGRYVCGPPPPSSSAVTQSIINVLDDYAVRNAGNFTTASFLHYFVEASKFGYAVRSKLSDPQFNPESMKLAKEITSEAYVNKLRSLITEKTHDIPYYGIDSTGFDDHGTTHASVVDYDGNAVSVTSTVNLLFGAGVGSESTGVIWNDNMDDFSSPGSSNYFGFKPSECNFIKPGKRPMSSMSPIIIYSTSHPTEVLSIGASGGSRIISGVSYVALRSLHFNEDLQDSTFAPRVHNQLHPSKTFHERGVPEDQLEELQKRGHTLIEWNTTDYHPKTSISAVKRVSRGTLFASAEYRCGSQSAPAGF